MHRRTFVVLSAGAVAGVALGLRAAWPGGANRVEPGPRYLARHESGVWGITDDPAAEEGVWVRHPSGVLGIAETHAGAALEGEVLRMVMTEDGVVGIEETGGDRLGTPP